MVLKALSVVIYQTHLLLYSERETPFPNIGWIKYFSSNSLEYMLIQGCVQFSESGLHNVYASNQLGGGPLLRFQQCGQRFHQMSNMSKFSFHSLAMKKYVIGCVTVIAITGQGLSPCYVCRNLLEKISSLNKVCLKLSMTLQAWK